MTKRKKRAEFFDYRGAIHIHTKFSDGSGSLKQIVKAGLKTHLDFLILSDHDTLALKEEGAEDWYENQLLVLVGEEVSFGNEHVLAVDIDDVIPKDEEPEAGLQAIHNQQGISFVVHPHGKYHIGIFHKDYQWNHWDTDQCNGIEVWSYMFDWISKVSLLKLPFYFLFPHRAITGPFRDTLARWDQISRRRRISGIGGLDVHAKGFWPIVVFSYRHTFQTVLTHVILEQPFARNLERDSILVYDALREGHAYIAYEKMGDPRGFKFTLEGPMNFAIMGDEVFFDPEDVLTVELPQKAQVRILRYGKPVMVGLSDGLTFQIREPGVYRVDAYREGNPWIFSNPIYVRGVNETEDNLEIDESY